MNRRITHVITGLPVGGSQTMLVKLVRAMQDRSWDSRVVSLRDVGVVGRHLQSLGVPVDAVGLRESPSALFALVRLQRAVSASQPGLVQTWLYHADLFGGLAARWNGLPVVWNIRQSNLDRRGDRRSTIAIARLCARLSRRVPARIVCCSEASRTFHAALGYDADRMIVIPNGFDMEAFRPDPEARDAVRAELGIDASTPLIGLVARLDPQKDHATFVQAAARLAAERPAIRFLLCGEGVDSDATLRSWVTEAGIATKCHLLGRRMDVPRVMAALDILTLTSAYGEGFPNVLGEAMACAVPCVATDVGDSASIIAETGRTVAPRDPAALAAAWRELIDAGPEGLHRLGEAARRRIAARFELPRTIARYESLYEEILADG